MGSGADRARNTRRGVHRAVRRLVSVQVSPAQTVISLRSTETEEIDTAFQNPNEPSARPARTKSRWFHVRVTNARKWAEATDVEVLLIRVEELDAADQFTAIWTGAIPLKWRYLGVDPATTKVVGHDAEADLVAFFKNGATTPHPFLLLQPLFAPNRLRIDRVGRCQLRLVLLARGRQVESNYLTVDLAWNGKWPETEEDAKRHIVVKPV